MIRVCLVDDQTLVRQGIRSLLGLADGIEVVGEASDGAAALDVIDQTAPDVVLLDLRMPRMDGIATLRALTARGVLPPTLVLTTFDDDAAVLDALRAGARGYLLKDVTLDQLVDAIETLADGRTLVQPAVTAGLVQRLAGHPSAFASAARPEPLTTREIEVLRLLAGGYANREIAGALFLSAAPSRTTCPTCCASSACATVPAPCCARSSSGSSPTHRTTACGSHGGGEDQLGLTIVAHRDLPLLLRDSRRAHGIRIAGDESSTPPKLLQQATWSEAAWSTGHGLQQIRAGSVHPRAGRRATTGIDQGG